MNAVLSDIRLGEVVRTARSSNASDIHLTAGSPPVFRIDGGIRPSGGATLDGNEIAALLREILPPAAGKRFERDKDVTVSLQTESFGSLRIHTYMSSRGPVAAIRLLPQEIPSLESLRLPRVVGDLASTSNGLVLFAGPTGSGKTTSLATFIDRINRTQARNIITIEDPIEYVHRAQRSIVQQREVGRDVTSFEIAIVEALRADPDVLLLGEMRTARSMHAALMAAETGHLVLGTLHTSSAPQTISRIVDAFATEQQAGVQAQLAQTIVAIICQRLVPRTSGGRCCVAEILIANAAVRNLIRDGKIHQLRNVMTTNRAIGMQTFEDALGKLVADGDIGAPFARTFRDDPSEIL